MSVSAHLFYVALLPLSLSFRYLFPLSYSLTLALISCFIFALLISLHSFLLDIITYLSSSSIFMTLLTYIFMGFLVLCVVERKCVLINIVNSDLMICN